MPRAQHCCVGCLSVCGRPHAAPAYAAVLGAALCLWACIAEGLQPHDAPEAAPLLALGIDGPVQYVIHSTQHAALLIILEECMRR